MTDTAANPETGAPAGPISRPSDVANALENVLEPGDYLEPTSEEEADAALEAEVAEEATEPAETEDEQVEVEEEEVEEPRPRRYKVKANGEEKEVTLDELKKGFQLESDYRQKTAKLAEERREIEAQRQRYEQQLDQFIPALQAQAQGKFANVDWVALAQEDPAEYTALRAEFDAHNSQYQLALAEKQYLEKQRIEEQRAELKERLQEENRRLVERYPVFGDPEKGKAVRADLKAYLRDEGYTDQDLESLADSRAVAIGYKAMLYDKAKAASAKAKTASKDAPKVQKAGTPVKSDPKAEQARALAERVKKTGRTDDVEAWLATQSIGSL